MFSEKGQKIAFEELVGLKPKIYSLLIDESSDHKKANDANRNVVVTKDISHDEYKDILVVM